MADRPQGMKHVDRDALYTDLSARVAYLKDFIGFGPGISRHIYALSLEKFGSPRGLRAAIPGDTDEPTFRETEEVPFTLPAALLIDSQMIS